MKKSLAQIFVAVDKKIPHANELICVEEKKLSTFSQEIMIADKIK